MTDAGMNDPYRPEGDDVSQSQRSTSMRLREPEVQGEQLMDPANQSLAEALRITYRIVQAAMVVLVFLFLFSGVQRIGEGERGIPLLFGRPTAEQLDPGLHFSAPFPIGEIVKIDATTSKVELMRQYWPQVKAGGEEDPIDRIPATTQLSPEKDGSLVTADLNIAHAQWKVEYRRVNQRQFAENIHPDAERAIVSKAVERGIVRVIAETTIDNLLKSGESSEGTIASRIKEIAQRMLSEDLNSGIVIDNVTLYRKMPPVRLKDQFASVQAALSNASKEQDDRRREANALLNSVAGRAAPPLIELIRAYESAVELEQTDRAREILAAINGVFEGREVVFEDIHVPANAASGEVTEIISQARSYATELRESAEADLRIFNAKLAQFEASPKLMLARDWVSAYRELMSKPFVQTMLLPQDAPARININADPDIMKEIYRQAKERQVQENMERRTREIQQKKYETSTEKVDIDS
ncbi:MAG: hypothetical protein Kow0022_08710 [Phycisphaerales bacterium]